MGLVGVLVGAGDEHGDRRGGLAAGVVVVEDGPDLLGDGLDFAGDGGRVEEVEFAGEEGVVVVASR